MVVRLLAGAIQRERILSAVILSGEAAAVSSVQVPMESLTMTRQGSAPIICAAESHGSADLVCTFCGKFGKEVGVLLQADEFRICDECVTLCDDIIVEGHAQAKSRENLGATTESDLERLTDLIPILKRLRCPPELLGDLKEGVRVSLDALPRGRAAVVAGPQESAAVPRGCSFCGAPESSLRRLIAGPEVCICDGCIRICNNLLDTRIALSPSSLAQPTSSVLDGAVALLNRFGQGARIRGLGGRARRGPRAIGRGNRASWAMAADSSRRVCPTARSGCGG